MGHRPRRSRRRALAVEHRGPDRAGVRPLAERGRAEDGRRALPLVAGRPVARRRRIHRVAPVEPAHRRRERVPPAPRPPGEGVRAHGRPEPRRVRRVPGPAEGRRRRRHAAERHPAPDRRRVVRVRRFRADADGAPLRGSVPARSWSTRYPSSSLLCRTTSPRTCSRIASGARAARSGTRSIRSLAFARGHPQRVMLIAHHLWEIVPPGSIGDEAAFVDARERALGARRAGPAGALGVVLGQRAARQRRPRGVAANAVRGGDVALPRPSPGKRRSGAVRAHREGGGADDRRRPGADRSAARALARRARRLLIHG